MRVRVNKFKLSVARKRQLAIAGMVAGSMAAIVGSAIYVIEGNKKKSAEVTQVQNKQQILKTDFTSPQAGITDNSLWMNTESSKIEDANRKISELETMVQELKEKENSSNPDTSKGLGPDGLGITASFLQLLQQAHCRTGCLQQIGPLNEKLCQGV